MSRPPPAHGTRERIVDAADALFHRQGFEKTSFGDIAQRVGLSRGNFYYHFRTKDEILAAVISLRAARTREMLAGWAAQEPAPAARLRCFAETLVRDRKDLQRHGCSVGTLHAELAKLDHPARGDAAMILGQFRRWLREQFAALGRRADADALAMHLLSRSQGIAALANAFRDEAFVRREVALIGDWLDSLAPAPAARRVPARRTS